MWMKMLLVDFYMCWSSLLSMQKLCSQKQVCNNFFMFHSLQLIGVWRMCHLVTNSPNAISIWIHSCDKKIKVVTSFRVTLLTRIRSYYMFWKAVSTIHCNKILRRQCFNTSLDRCPAKESLVFPGAVTETIRKQQSASHFAWIFTP